jgi:hypothetical protein
MRECLLALVVACHRQIPQSYARTGWAVHFEPGTFSHDVSGQSSHAYRKDGRFYLRATLLA